MSAAEPTAAAAGEIGSAGDGARPPLPLTPAEHLERVRRDTTALAETLREASDAGVSHALILPQLVLVFRQAFGEMPAGFTIPGMPQGSGQ